MNADRLAKKNEFDGSLVFGSCKFNMTTGRDSHMAKRDSLKDEFLDPETGKIREKYSRKRACPLCDASSDELIFVKNGFSHVRCKECRFFYVNPILNEERLHNFYLGEESYTKVLTNELQVELDRKKFHYGLEIVEKYAPQGKLLDIGCGPGISLDVAKKRGWQIEGVEFNEWCVKRLRQSGILIHDKPLEVIHLPANTYQCVALWTVLEHIQSPRNLIREIHRILAPGGALLILVPNIDSLAARMLHEKCATFSGDSHINFFNAETLSRLLAQLNFITRECETLLTESGTIGNHLDFDDPYFGQGRFKLDCLTPEYIHKNLLGYLLLGVFTKQ